LKVDGQTLKMAGGALVVLAAAAIIMPAVFSFAAGIMRIVIFLGVGVALAVAVALLISWVRKVQSDAAADIKVESNGKHGEESEVHNRN
jgi:hypothetical protein